jgi:hypothetical protein
MLAFLSAMDRQPELYDKFNMVEFKRADHPGVELNRDIDGLTTLSINYGKIESFEKITASTKMPCSEAASEYADKDLVITRIEWPTTADIVATLDKAPARKQVERFQFNTEFLVFLAQRQASLRLNPEVAFERSYNGDYFLTTWLEQMAKEIKSPQSEQDYVNYWLKEISSHSSQARSIQFFGIGPDSAASVGVKVDTAGKLQRKLNNYQEPSYLFMSYKQQNGNYISGTLKDLNHCLQSLTGIYRNPLSMGTALEREPASFLAPGHSCSLDETEETENN